MPRSKLWKLLQTIEKKNQNRVTIFFVFIFDACRCNQTVDEEWHHRPRPIRWYLWLLRRLTETANDRNFFCQWMEHRTRQSLQVHQVRAFSRHTRSHWFYSLRTNDKRHFSGFETSPSSRTIIQLNLKRPLRLVMQFFFMEHYNFTFQTSIKALVELATARGNRKKKIRKLQRQKNIFAFGSFFVQLSTVRVNSFE